MAMKLSTLIRHLMDFNLQFTEYKYSVAVLRNVTGVVGAHIPFS